MPYNESGMPLNLQNPGIAKAAKDSPSYESFRPNIMHHSGYQSFDDHHVSMANESRLRRYPNGELDYQWALLQIVDSMKRYNYNPQDLTPIKAAMLTVLFPGKIRAMEPAVAELRTQLSQTEKDRLREMVRGWVLEVANWNAGAGGSSHFPQGQHLTDVGG